MQTFDPNLNCRVRCEGSHDCTAEMTPMPDGFAAYVLRSDAVLAIESLRTELAATRADLVWAVDRNLTTRRRNGTRCKLHFVNSDGPDWIAYEFGSGLLAAIRRARLGENGGESGGE